MREQSQRDLKDPNSVLNQARRELREINTKKNILMLNYSFVKKDDEFSIEVTINPTKRLPPLDAKIPPTIAAIFLDFFRDKE